MDDVNPKMDALLIDSSRTKRLETRDMLIREFHVESAFVGIPKLARILGIAPSTIYGYMRMGTFFLPYRLINTTAMINVDDLVEWICGQASVVAVSPASRPVDCSEPLAPPSNFRVRKIMDSALAEMGLGGLGSSGRRRKT